MSQRDLGASVGLSPNAAGSRLGRLVDRGIITGFGATVDHAKLGRSLEATVDIWLRDRHEAEEDFIDIASRDDRVTELMHITGPVDYRMRVQVASADDLHELLNMLREEGGVTQTDSRLVLFRPDMRTAGE